MPADLFRDTLAAESRRGPRSPSSLAVSMVVHALLVGAAIVVPLVATDVLPPPLRSSEVYHVTAALPAAPPPPPAPRGTHPATPAVESLAGAPLQAPEGIRPETGIVTAVDPSAANGVEGGVPGTVAGEPIEAPPPPSPPPPERRTAPVRPGGQVRMPARIDYVAPEYPPMAASARVEGVVVVEAILDVDGRVSQARVLRSIPLLDQAALDAVRQWRYTPTLLNGVPVPLVLTVTVRFSLGT